MNIIRFQLNCTRCNNPLLFAFLRIPKFNLNMMGWSTNMRSAELNDVRHLSRIHARCRTAAAEPANSQINYFPIVFLHEICSKEYCPGSLCGL